MNINTPDTDPCPELFPEDAPGFEFPPLMRKPHEESRECMESRLRAITRRMAWLDSRGLRAHPTVLARRDELVFSLSKSVDHSGRDLNTE